MLISINQGIVTGVVGVIFFIINAAFSLILLIMVLVATIFAIVSKNPDTRYQPMRDDRGSFIKSQTQLNTELDALGATARGDMAQKGSYFSRDLDEDTNSFSSDGKHHPAPPMVGVGAHDPAGMPLPPSTAQSMHQQPPRSPIDPYHQNLPTGGGVGRQDVPLMPPYSRGDSGHSSNPSAFRAQNNGSPWQRGAGYDH